MAHSHKFLLDARFLTNSSLNKLLSVCQLSFIARAINLISLKFVEVCIQQMPMILVRMTTFSPCPRHRSIMIESTQEKYGISKNQFLEVVCGNGRNGPQEGQMPNNKLLNTALD